MDDLRLAQLKARESQLKTALWEKEAQHRDLLAAKAKAEKERIQALQDEEDYYRYPERSAGAIHRYIHGTAERQQIIAKEFSNLLPAEWNDWYTPRYHALSEDGRLATLGVLLDLRVGRDGYAYLVPGMSDFSQGRHVFRHRGPAPLDEWRRQLPIIKEHLDNTLDWHVERIDALHVCLICRAPLPNPLLFDPVWLLPNHLFLGVSLDDHCHIQIPLDELTHLLLAGASGSGKSTALHVLCQSVFANLNHFERVYLVDGKGVAFNRYANIAPDKVEILWETEDFERTVAQLVATMEARFAEQRAAGIDNATEGFIALIVDEVAAFIEPPADKAEREAHKAMLVNLQRLARRGRSAGIRLIFTLQDPTDQSLNTAIRSQLQTILSFRLAIPQHVSALFGDQAELPARVRDLTQGRAIYQNKNTGTTALVQLPILPTPTPKPPSEGE